MSVLPRLRRGPAGLRVRGRSLSRNAHSDATWLHVQEYAPPAERRRRARAVAARLGRRGVAGAVRRRCPTDRDEDARAQTRHRAVHAAGRRGRVPSRRRRRLRAAGEPARLSRHGTVSRPSAVADADPARSARQTFLESVRVYLRRDSARNPRRRRAHDVGRPVEHVSELGAAQSRTERARSAQTTV